MGAVTNEPPFIRTTQSGKSIPVRASLRVMAIQLRRHTCTVHWLPRALQGTGPTPAILPAVEGTLAVVGVALRVDLVHAKGVVPMAGHARRRRETRMGFGYRRRACSWCGRPASWRARRRAMKGTASEAQQGGCHGSRNQSVHGGVPSGLSMTRRCTSWVLLATGCPWPIHSPLFASPAREMRATS